MRFSYLFSVILLIPLFVAIHFLSPASYADDDDCVEILVNGDMENYTGWSIYQGGYSGGEYLSPVRSAQLGIIDGENTLAQSWLHQDVDVPAGNYLALSWHMYPLSSPFDSEDLQSVSIRDSQSTILRRVWSGVRADEAWMSCSFDLSEFLNQSINLYFSVRNDGDGGKTAMYVDDVSLKMCQTPPLTLDGCLPATPTNTPTPTATPASVSLYFPMITRF